TASFGLRRRFRARTVGWWGRPLTNVGTGRDAQVVGRGGRWKTVCARVANPALLRGRSTSPLGAYEACATDSRSAVPLCHGGGGCAAGRIVLRCVTQCLVITSGRPAGRGRSHRGLVGIIVK